MFLATNPMIDEKLAGDVAANPGGPAGTWSVDSSEINKNNRHVYSSANDGIPVLHILLPFFGDLSKGLSQQKTSCDCPSAGDSCILAALLHFPEELTLSDGSQASATWFKHSSEHREGYYGYISWYILADLIRICIVAVVFPDGSWKQFRWIPPYYIVLLQSWAILKVYDCMWHYHCNILEQQGVCGIWKPLLHQIAAKQVFDDWYATGSSTEPWGPMQFGMGQLLLR